MSNVSYHYFLSQSQGESLNEFIYRLNQFPINWIYKGNRLRRDAQVMYKASERNRRFIVNQLEKEKFNFERFYGRELTYAVEKILEANPKKFLPDFASYYLLTHLSLENILKSFWLDSNMPKVGFKRLPKELKTHNLKSLCHAVDIRLMHNEEVVLDKLSDLFIGYSRYPVKSEVKPEIGVNEIDVGDRDFGSVCFDCLKNPYRVDRQIIDGIFKRKLLPKFDAVGQNHHTHLVTGFDLKEEADA